MRYEQLKEILTNTLLFTPAEVHKIVRTCGSFTIGNAIIACEINNIKLTGNDIDIMIQKVEKG